MSQKVLLADNFRHMTGEMGGGGKKKSEIGS